MSEHIETAYWKCNILTVKDLVKQFVDVGTGPFQLFHSVKFVCFGQLQICRGVVP